MARIRADKNVAEAFAPATASNIAVGFDILGFPIQGVGDKVTLQKRNDQQLCITDMTGPDCIPRDAKRNTATVVLAEAILALNLNIGFDVRIEKGIAVGSGMGGSAASAVAAMVAFNQFLENPLSLHELARFALYGEKLASGVAHGDNVIPCLFGGLTLIRGLEPIDVLALPVPEMMCVMVHPDMVIETEAARACLPSAMPLTTVVKQTANLASFISALYTKDLQQLGQSLEDHLIETHRSHLITGFQAVKTAALQAGALACGISGSGPTLFAFAKSLEAAEAIKASMLLAWQKLGIDAEAWCSPISTEGAVALNGSNR